MDIQYYCYTRNNCLDYGDFVSPDFLQNKQIVFIREKIQSVTGDSYPRFSVPKWAFIKFDNVIVWGCCCWSSLLSANITDPEARNIYGFFSIVIKNYLINDVKLPVNLDYFKDLFAREIEPYIKISERRVSETIHEIPDKYECIQVSQNGFCDLLNTDMFICKSLGELDKKEVVAAALTLDNVSLLIDNDNIEQATNRSGFMNCLTSSVDIGLHSVRQQCPKCKRYVSSFTESGICLGCQESKEEEKRIQKEKENMDRRIKNELEEAKSKNEILESEVESFRRQLKKKNRLIKILWIICGILLLLCMWLYKHSGIEISSVFSENRLSMPHENISKEKVKTSYFIKVNSEKIEISPDGDET